MRASWQVHGQYYKRALPFHCWQGTSPGPAAVSSHTRAAPSISDQHSAPPTAPEPAPIHLSQVYPPAGLGDRRWESHVGAQGVSGTCCSWTLGTSLPFQAGCPDLKRPHLTRKASAPASRERAEVEKLGCLFYCPGHPFPECCAITGNVQDYVSHKHCNHSQILGVGVGVCVEGVGVREQ